MANTVVHLQPGTFYAGISRPWYASQAAVQNAMRSDFGFGSVKFHARSVALPAAVRSRLSAAELADKGWDEWLEASYTGVRRDVTHSKQWSWLVEPSSAAVPAPPVRPSPSPAPRLPAAPAAAPDAFPTRQAPWAGEGSPPFGPLGAVVLLLGVGLGGWALLRLRR